MAKSDEDRAKVAALRVRLLEWYAQHQRNLPWRQSSNPYAIWVSEIMLQQTRVAVVEDRYQEFMKRFPTLISLALAPEQDVLALWSGLGYYRRARMLHKAAEFVAAHLGGNLPTRAEELRTGSPWRWSMEMWSACFAGSRAGRRAAAKAAGRRCGTRLRIWRVGCSI